MRTTRYYGNKEFGYTAERGMVRAGVRRKGKGWESSYAGSPVIHNPWVRNPGGGRTRSCMCPRIVVGTFPTRGEAAKAALDKKQEEDREEPCSR